MYHGNRCNWLKHVLYRCFVYSFNRYYKMDSRICYNELAIRYC